MNIKDDNYFSKNQENLEKLKKAISAIQIPEGYTYTVPPPSNETLKGNYLNYIPYETLISEYTLGNEFSNPQGTAQGGFTAACFDNSFGLMSVATVRKPVASIDMNVQYLRPVPINEAFFVVVSVISVTPSTLFLKGEAFNSKKKLLAFAITNLAILRQ